VVTSYEGSKFPRTNLGNREKSGNRDCWVVLVELALAGGGTSSTGARQASDRNDAPEQQRHHEAAAKHGQRSIEPRLPMRPPV